MIILSGTALLGILRELSVVHHFELRRRRSLIRAQGWSVSDNPGYQIKNTPTP